MSTVPRSNPSPFDLPLNGGTPPPVPSLDEMPSFFRTLFPMMCLLELLLYVPTLPLVFFCATVVLLTALLHPHLKCILAAQCAQALVYAFSRLHMLYNEALVFGGAPFFEPPLYIFALNFGAIVFGNLIGHVLIIERILATVWVQTYEHWRHWGFTAGWAFITILLSFANAYYQTYILGTMMNISAITLWTHVVALLASFVEIFLISLVTYLNEKKFALRMNAAARVEPLTVRYQLTENIRTGRQLAPVFLCHFVSVVLPFCVIFNFHIKFMTDFVGTLLMVESAFLVHAFNNLLLLLLLIICHPLLNRRAKAMLKTCRTTCKCLSRSRQRVGPISDGNNEPIVIGQQAEIYPILKPPRRRNRPATNSTDAHFIQLISSWGDEQQNQNATINWKCFAKFTIETNK